MRLQTRQTFNAISINIAILLIIIAAFDIATYHFLPGEYAARFTTYRHFQHGPRDIAGRGGYPKDYFTQNAVRGFDIRKNSHASHWAAGLTYPIWSNSLGCFDREHEETTPYVYLAGDSFTWGYTPYEQKFGTLIEEWTGKNVFKCGVTHTGQRHQYDKLIEIIETVHRYPQAIIIFYAHNDVANDYLYPHSTVLDGWLLDRVGLDRNGELVWLSEEELSTRLSERLRQIEAKNTKSWFATWWGVAKRYSLTVNLGDYVKDSISEALAKPDDTTALDSFYDLPLEAGGVFSYSNNPIARENKEAIRQFKTFADAHGIQLALVLIPPKYKADNTYWYDELREFLGASGIIYIDLAKAFADKEIDTSKIYWDEDGHFNPAGNELVATILIENFPDLLAASR